MLTEKPSIFVAEPLTPIGLCHMRMLPGASKIMLYADTGPVCVFCQDEEGTPFSFVSRRMVNPDSLHPELREQLRRQDVRLGDQAVIISLGLAIYQGSSPSKGIFRLAFFDTERDTAHYIVIEPQGFASLARKEVKQRVAA